MKNSKRLILCFCVFIAGSACQNEQKTTKVSSSPVAIVTRPSVEIINGTFLGGEKRNFYGRNAPDTIDTIARFWLGKGKTLVGNELRDWAGAGWTGQPLLTIEDSTLYIYQNSNDHYLHKIRKKDLTEIWRYAYDDVLKATGTIYLNQQTDSLKEEDFFVMQGSRLGIKNHLHQRLIPSYRAVACQTGQELWRMNSRKTRSYSRDVDASCLLINDTAYLGLENGTFISFLPQKNKADSMEGIFQPKILTESKLYTEEDVRTHGGNLVTEASPARLGNEIYIASGSGHVFAWGMKEKRIIGDFFTGSDMDGTPVVTTDSCILVTLEEQYIAGKGGVFKLLPKKIEDSIIFIPRWYFPVNSHEFRSWKGGIIGSAAINDQANLSDEYPSLAAFSAIDGNLYVVDYQSEDTLNLQAGPANKKQYPTPRLLFTYPIGMSISTPIFVDNKLIACSYKGLYIFEYDSAANFRNTYYNSHLVIEATPFVYDRKIYVPDKHGWLYKLGEKTSF